MSSPITGRCLCGAVTYQIDVDPLKGIHCHCSDCRKASGTGHATIAAFPKDAFSYTGNVKGYTSTSDSGNKVTRNFCPECGSHVFGGNHASPEVLGVMVGTFDDPNLFTPDVIVYDSRAPHWDVMDQNLPRFDEMPHA